MVAQLRKGQKQTPQAAQLVSQLRHELDNTTKIYNPHNFASVTVTSKIFQDVHKEEGTTLQAGKLRVRFLTGL